MMERFSRADIVIIEDGEFWSQPKDKEFWEIPFDPKTGSAKDFIGFLMGRGFPGGD